jgi:hypothetical protein
MTKLGAIKAINCAKSEPIIHDKIHTLDENLNTPMNVTSQNSSWRYNNAAKMARATSSVNAKDTAYA